MSRQEQEGGAVWEAREALKVIRFARDAGNDEDEYLGWLRYAEAVTNGSYSGAAAAFVGILTQRETELMATLERLAGERKTESNEILALLKGLQGGQSELQAGFQKVGERLDDLDTRHAEQWGKAIAEIEQVRAWVAESREHRQQLQEQIDAVQAGMLPEAERERLIGEHTENGARITNLELRLGDLEQRFDELRRQLREAP